MQSLTVQNFGKPDVAYIVRGQLGAVEYRPRERTLTLRRPDDAEITDVRDGATAAVKKAELKLSEGRNELHLFLARWYYELPELLAALA